MKFKFVTYEEHFRKENMTVGKIYKVLNTVEAHKIAFVHVKNDVGESVVLRVEI